MAVMDGKVIITDDKNDYGRYIILAHPDGYKSLYAHLSVISVKQGDKVIRGNKIGEVGNTGKSLTPHLHFGVIKDGNYIDPLTLTKND